MNNRKKKKLLYKKLNPIFIACLKMRATSKAFIKFKVSFKQSRKKALKRS